MATTPTYLLSAALDAHTPTFGDVVSTFLQGAYHPMKSCGGARQESCVGRRTKVCWGEDLPWPCSLGMARHELYTNASVCVCVCLRRSFEPRAQTVGLSQCVAPTCALRGDGGCRSGEAALLKDVRATAVAVRLALRAGQSQPRLRWRPRPFSCAGGGGISTIASGDEKTFRHTCT